MLLARIVQVFEIRKFSHALFLGLFLRYVSHSRVSEERMTGLHKGAPMFIDVSQIFLYYFYLDLLLFFFFYLFFVFCLFTSFFRTSAVDVSVAVVACAQCQTIFKSHEIYYQAPAATSTSTLASPSALPLRSRSSCWAVHSICSLPLRCARSRSAGIVFSFFCDRLALNCYW